MFAHVAGVPFEEMVPLAVTSGTGLLLWVRAAWQRRRSTDVSRP